MFFSDTSSADALGYGIGVIVVNLLSNFILVGMLPICGELLWVDVYATMNTFFCCASLFESAFSIMLEQLQEDHLLPLWIKVPFEYVHRKIHEVRRGRSGVEPADAQTVLSQAESIDESVAGVIYRRRYSKVESAEVSSVARVAAKDSWLRIAGSV